MSQYPLPLLIPFLAGNLLAILLLFYPALLDSIRHMILFSLAKTGALMIAALSGHFIAYARIYHLASIVNYCFLIWISSELFSLVTHTRTEKIVIRYILGIMILTAFLKTCSTLHWVPWLTFGILSKLLVAVPLLWSLEWSNALWSVQNIDIAMGLVSMVALGATAEVLGLQYGDQPPVWFLSLYQWPAVIGFGIWVIGLRCGKAKAASANQ